MRKKGNLSLTVEEIEKAKALSAMGRSYRAIGRELGRSSHTIKRALTSSAQIVGEVQAIKADLADVYKSKARDVLESITDADISKASLQQKSISSGVLLDKSLLLTGQATAIVDVRVLLDVCQLIRDQREKEDEAQMQNWQQAHTLPVSATVERILPAPSAEPIPTPIPAASQKRAPEPPSTNIPQSVALTPGMRVRYFAPTEVEKDSSEGDPLLRGLFNPAE